MRRGAGPRALRVVIELDSSDLRNGAVNDVFDLAYYAGPFGVRFYLCGVLSPEVEQVGRDRGMTIVHGRSVTFSRRRPDLFAANALAWLMRFARIRPDIVHLNYVGWSHSLAWAAHVYRVPVVARAGGKFDPANPSNGWVRAYVANSRAHAASLLDSPLGNRVVITGPLFRMERLEETKTPVKPIPLRAGPRFLFLGQLSERKGVRVLVEAFARTRPPAELMIVGGDWSQGGLPRELRDRIAALGLADRVRLENHRPDVRALLDASDVLVLPSLGDAQPRVIIEAMFAGLPVISTRVGGIPDLVSHEETGSLVPPGDVQALAHAIERMSESQDLRRRLGTAGRARAEREFRPERTAERYVALYRRLARGTRL